MQCIWITVATAWILSYLNHVHYSLCLLSWIEWKQWSCTFNKTPRWENLLTDVTSKDGTCTSKPLLDVCQTRWAASHDAYTHFFLSFKTIVKSLQVKSLGLHSNKYTVLKWLHDGVSNTKQRQWTFDWNWELWVHCHIHHRLPTLVAFVRNHRWQAWSTSHGIVNAFKEVNEIDNLYKESTKSL